MSNAARITCISIVTYETLNLILALVGTITSVYIEFFPGIFISLLCLFSAIITTFAAVDAFKIPRQTQLSGFNSIIRVLKREHCDLFRYSLTGLNLYILISAISYFDLIPEREGHSIISAYLTTILCQTSLHLFFSSYFWISTNSPQIESTLTLGDQNHTIQYTERFALSYLIYLTLKLITLVIIAGSQAVTSIAAIPSIAYQLILMIQQLYILQFCKRIKANRRLRIPNQNPSSLYKSIWFARTKLNYLLKFMMFTTCLATITTMGQVYYAHIFQDFNISSIFMIDVFVILIKFNLFSIMILAKLFCKIGYELHIFDQQLFVNPQRQYQPSRQDEIYRAPSHRPSESSAQSNQQVQAVVPPNPVRSEELAYEESLQMAIINSLHQNNHNRQPVRPQPSVMSDIRDEDYNNPEFQEFLFQLLGNSAQNLTQKRNQSILSQIRTCPICAEPLTGRRDKPLGCAHVFHVACIEQWMQRSRTCPMCRRVVD